MAGDSSAAWIHGLGLQDIKPENFLMQNSDANADIKVLGARKVLYAHRRCTYILYIDHIAFYTI